MQSIFSNNKQITIPCYRIIGMNVLQMFLHNKIHWICCVIHFQTISAIADE